MDAGARGWLVKTAVKNYWRVQSRYELDDLIQDGFLCWAKVRARYPKVKDRPHVMRLFQVTYINHIHSLAKCVTRKREQLVPTGDMGSEAFWDAVLPADCDLMQINVVGHVPAVVVRALSILSRPGADRRLSAQYRVRPDGSRETLNERLCRVLDLDHKTIDMVSMIKTALTT